MKSKTRELERVLQIVSRTRHNKGQDINNALLTCSKRSLCNRATCKCFSFSPCKHCVRGSVILRSSSSASYSWCALLSSRDASICLMVAMMRLASSVRSVFSAATRRTWFCKVSERAAKSYTRSAHEHRLASSGSYLGFSRLALAVRDAYLIEKRVQLPNDGRHLLLQVAGVHLGCRVLSRSEAGARARCLGLGLNLGPGEQ